MRGTDDDGAGSPGPDDSDRLMEAVYAEVRALAAAHLRRERAGHTLQPTALAHEAYLRLRETDRMAWRDRGHFLVAAASAIRRVLVDHARRRGAGKRGGDRGRVTLSGLEAQGVPGVPAAPAVDVLALEDLLHQLADYDERKCRVVVLRFFGGLSIAETADALGVGTTTVEEDWAFARAWLRRRLSGPEGGEGG